MRSQARALPRPDDRRTRLRAAASARAAVSNPHLLAARIGNGPEGEVRLRLEPLSAPTLARVLRRGPLGPKAAVTILVGLARAVDALEGHRLVARDLAPDHVLLDRKRGAVLAEYGLPPGLVPLGRPDPDPKAFYRAPEEAGGRLTPRSSVYSLGAILLAALTGEAQPERLDGRAGARLREIPAPLASVIERALAPDPRQRYANVAELAQAASATIRAAERRARAAADTRQPSATPKQPRAKVTKLARASKPAAKPARNGTSTNGKSGNGRANGNTGAAKPADAAKTPRLLSRLHTTPAETTPKTPKTSPAPREAAKQQAAERADRERRAKEAAERKAAEKAERERRAKEAAERKAAEKAERERRAKEAAERKAAERAQRDAKKRAERERRAKEAAERKAAERAAERKRERGAGHKLPVRRRGRSERTPHQPAAKVQTRRPAATSEQTARRRRVVAVSVVGLLAAAAGAIALANGGDTGAGRASQISNGDLSMRLPAGWEQIHPATARFGPLSSVLAAKPSKGDGTVLLTGMVGEPTETTDALRRLAPNGTKPVPARLGRLDVTRYDNLRSGAGSNARAYMLNTTGPSVLIVCEADAGATSAPLRACSRVASTLRLEHELPLSRASAKARGPAADKAIADLGRERLAARKRIAKATIAEDQARAARDLQVIYYEASRRVEATGLPGAGVERLVAALAAAGDSYGSLAAAIRDGDQVAYDDARADVIAREATVWQELPAASSSAADQP